MECFRICGLLWHAFSLNVSALEVCLSNVIMKQRMKFGYISISFICFDVLFQLKTQNPFQMTLPIRVTVSPKVRMIAILPSAVTH